MGLTDIGLIPYRVNSITIEGDRRWRGELGRELWKIRLVDPRGGVIKIFCSPRPRLRVGSVMHFHAPKPHPGSGL